MAKKSLLTKNSLYHALQDLLQNASLETQEEICQALGKQGFAVNQARVSRLLHKIGAIKMNESGRIIYRLPVELTAVTPKNSVIQLILGISKNETLIVINTAPGSAQLVARLLDQQKASDLGILGTIAGDDTVFIAPQSIHKIGAVYQQITKLLLG